MAGSTIETQRLENSGITVGEMITVNGSMKSDATEELHSALDTILRSPVKNVLLNLAHVTEVDASELGILRGYADTFKGHSGYFALVNMTDSFTATINEAALDGVFSSFPAVHAAVNAFMKLMNGSAKKTEEAVIAEDDSAPLELEESEKPVAEAGPDSSKVFPKQAACPNCKIDLTVPDTGRYKCVRCGEAFSAEPNGKLRNLGMRENVYFQVTLPTHKDYIDGLKPMVEGSARRLYISTEESRKMAEAVAEVCSLIITHADDSSGRALFQMIFVAEGGKVMIKTSDSGRHFNLEDGDIKKDPRLKNAQEVMDLLEYRQHPKQGNMVTMAKRLPKVV